MGDTYDKASKLLIGNEDLEQAKFLKTLLEKIAVRVGNEFETPLHIIDVGATKGITFYTEGVVPDGQTIEIPAVEENFIARFVIENKAPIDDAFTVPIVNINTLIQFSTDGVNFDSIKAGYEAVIEPRATRKVYIKSNSANAPYGLRINFEEKEV
jgi:hypothetical protein